jgi:hypothetical protein
MSLRVTPEKIMMTCVIFVLHYIISVKSRTCKTCRGNEKCSQSCGDRDSVGGIETCYGPGGAGFESRWGDFSRARSGWLLGPHIVLHN